VIVVATEAVDIRKFEVPAPSEPWALVRVEACGLCTWEQRVYRGAKPTYPFWGGHEVCGIVEEISGARTTGVGVGDRVAIALMRRCGHCEYCRRGQDNHCSYVRPEGPDGLPAGPRGLSEVIVVPMYKLFRLSRGVTPEDGALVEPVACALRSIDMARRNLAGAFTVVLGARKMSSRMRQSTSEICESPS
jgi:L-iditol 2-dehydrogenase